jgi:uncharacterized membrane protein
MERNGASRRDERVAVALGWFSNGLAVAQLAAPRRFLRAIGGPDGRVAQAIVRVVGLREAAAGVGLLAQRRKAGWLWARLAGDALDLALLGAAMASERANRRRLAGATIAAAGVAVTDALVAERLSRERITGAPNRVRKAITVNRPPDDVYAFWRDFENFPRFMTHLESVEVTDEDTSRWRARGPAGRTVEWEARIVDDQPGRRIAWGSLPGADVENAGSVTFTPAPGNRGTEVHVELEYAPPGGPLGPLVAKLFGEEPDTQLNDDLRRFKQVIETGEVVRSEASPAGASLVQHLKQRAAQPAAERQPRATEGRPR